MDDKNVVPTHDNRGKFAKGNCANPAGRPRNAEPELLRQALAKEGEKRGITFWQKVAEYAFTDKSVMVAVIKKFVPDISEVNISGDSAGNKVVQIVYTQPQGQDGNRLAEGRAIALSAEVSTKQ